MTTETARRPRPSAAAVVVGIVGAVVAFPAGLFGMALALGWAVYLLGGGAVLVGAIAAPLGRRWGFPVLGVGVGLLVGAAAYIMLGLAAVVALVGAQRFRSYQMT